MSELTVIYRACPSELKEYRPERPNWFSKLKCYKSFYNNFGGKYDIFVVWDGCRENELYNLIKSTNVHILEINERNNQKSLLRCYELADSLQPKALFFSEDDYLFLPNSDNVLLDGLNSYGFTTLYNHPDRCLRNDDITYGMEKIEAGIYDYFRTAESTTCSVAMSYSVFKKVRAELDYWCKAGTGAPEDRKFYRDVYQKYGLRLWTPITSYSTHVVKGCLGLYIDWEGYSKTL